MPDHERVDLGELVPRAPDEAAVVELLDRPDRGVGREQQLGRGRRRRASGGRGADRGRDPRGGARERRRSPASDEHERRDGERHGEQPPRAGGEDERLGLRAAEDAVARSGEHDPGARPRATSTSTSASRAAASVSAAPAPRRHREQLGSTRALRRSHPDAQPSGLVVLELEQMEHEVQAARRRATSSAERGGDEPDGGHPLRRLARLLQQEAARHRPELAGRVRVAVVAGSLEDHQAGVRDQLLHPLSHPERRVVVLVAPDEQRRGADPRQPVAAGRRR